MAKVIASNRLQNAVIGSFGSASLVAVCVAEAVPVWVVWLVVGTVAVIDVKPVPVPVTLAVGSIVTPEAVGAIEVGQFCWMQLE